MKEDPSSKLVDDESPAHNHLAEAEITPRVSALVKMQCP